MVKEIIRYYDHLVKTANYKVSKNPIGFLYRAVEKPENFVVPKDFLNQIFSSENPHQAREHVQKRRPELRVFKASRVE